MQLVRLEHTRTAPETLSALAVQHFSPPPLLLLPTRVPVTLAAILRVPILKMLVTVGGIIPSLHKALNNSQWGV